MSQQHATKRRYARLQQYKKPGKSMTEQNHARQCDINAIMARYLKTGVLDHVTKYEPTYGDISELDYKKSLDTICRVESEFYELPAFVREHYQGDPQNYINAITTPEGLDELRNLKPAGMQYERDGTRSKAPEAAQEPPQEQKGDTEGVT